MQIVHHSGRAHRATLQMKIDDVARSHAPPAAMALFSSGRRQAKQRGTTRLWHRCPARPGLTSVVPIERVRLQRLTGTHIVRKLQTVAHFDQQADFKFAQDRTVLVAGGQVSRVAAYDSNNWGAGLRAAAV